MGFFTRIIRSWNKSSKLQKLEYKISPPPKRDFSVDTTRFSISGREEQARAFEEFLDLCERDKNVSMVMMLEGLNRSDLKELYKLLMLNGLGQWVKGHQMALSTLAYPEPLRYTVRAQKQDVNIREIVVNLMDYWDDKFPPGGLIALVS